MNTEAHLAAGWILAHLGGVEDRRFRAAVTLAAIAPDVDSLAFFFGERAYASIHHALGHNVYFFTGASVLAALWCRRRWWKVLLFTQLALYSHYFGDYFLTRFPLEFYWPASHRLFIHGYRIGLDHPINTALSYASLLVFFVMAFWCRRTPLEIISPALDRRVVNLLPPKRMACHICGRPSSERCDVCGEPVCMRHGRINRHLGVTCAKCHAAAAPSPTSASRDD